MAAEAFWMALGHFKRVLKPSHYFEMWLDLVIHPQSFKSNTAKLRPLPAGHPRIPLVGVLPRVPAVQRPQRSESPSAFT
jgi:hypothetical protein